MPHTRADWIPSLFAERGLRFTRQRRVLYEALCATKQHPTAEELYVAVTPATPGMSLATVYNTLEALCRAGLAQKLPSPDGTARYDAGVDNHVHARCLKTGKVMDLPDDLNRQFLASLPADALAQFEQQFRFKIQRIRIELIGEQI